MTNTLIYSSMMPKIISAQELVDASYPVRNDVVPGVVPDGTSLLVSQPKLGKTWLTLGIALAKSSGGQALGSIDVKPGNVLYLALEDGERRIQERLMAILDGAKPPRNLEFGCLWPPADQGGIIAIEQWIKTRDNPVLVVIDTIKRLRPDAKMGKSLYDIDYEAIAPLNDLSHRWHIGIIGNHHTRKMEADDVLDAVSGTHGLTAACDTIMVLQKSRSQVNAILHIIGRDIGECDKTLAWRMPNWILTTEESNMSVERREILELLKGMDEPITPKEAAAMLNKTYNNVKYLMWRMSQNGDLRSHSGKYIAADLKSDILSLGGINIS